MPLNLYAIVAVVFRTAGVIIVLQALYAAVINLIVGVSGFQFVFLGGLLIPLIAGIVLWLIAKPVARAVTSGL